MQQLVGVSWLHLIKNYCTRQTGIKTAFTRSTAGKEARILFPSQGTELQHFFLKRAGASKISEKKKRSVIKNAEQKTGSAPNSK